MRIGKFAEISGVSARMLRYYEEMGLLQPGRTASGYRDYGKADLARVRLITALSGAGMTLQMIRPLLDCSQPGDAPENICPAMQRAMVKKLTELDQNILLLADQRSRLRQYLGAAGK